MSPLSSPPILPTPPVADGAPALRGFLADRDTACPECGYNLRDATGGACPECGETLEITLRGSSPFGRRSPYVLLVFLWLLAAGAIHGTQVGRSIHETINRSNVLVWSVNTGGNVTSLFSPRSSTPGSTTITPSPTVTINGNGTITSGSGTTINSGALSFSMPQANATRAGWSRVTWRQWVATGIWSTIGALALVGIVFLWLARRRAESSTLLVRTIPVLAWGGFGLYCVMHLLSSVLSIL